jgi:hypothetical protein
MKIIALALAMGVVGIASAVVVPNSAAGVDADGTFALTSTAAAGRTFQLLIGANQLTGLLNNNLNSMAFRLNNSATAAWPSVATSFADWEIRIGAGVSPGAMSNTFAANFSGGNTLVRDGAMNFGVNSFTVGGNPNAFGVALDFNQTSYLYTGGDLCIEMRYSGQVGATNQPSFDAVLASGGPANGWGVNFAARWTSNMLGTTGGNGNFIVTDLRGTPVPEPATMAALGLGALALVRRRRK